MTQELSLYQLFNTINNATALGEIADTANAKYNDPVWKMYCDKQAPQMVDVWRKTLEEKEVEVKASVVSANSSLPVRSLSGGKEMIGNIVRIGHSFLMEASDINDIIRTGSYGEGVEQYYYKKLLDRTTARIVGIHSRINDMVFQGLSTGKIIFNYSNNPDGIPYEYDLKVPASNKLCCKHATKKWSDDDYDVLADLKRMVDVAKKQGITYTHFEMPQAKFDRLVSHPLTLAQYRTFAGYGSSDPVANIGSDIVWELIRKNLGLPFILIIDEMSKIEIDGIPTVSSADWDANNIVLRGSSSFYDLYNSVPLNFYDNNPATITTAIENNMIVIQKKFQSDPIQEKIGFEAMVMPVAKNPKNIVILNTNKAASNGLGI